MCFSLCVAAKILIYAYFQTYRYWYVLVLYTLDKRSVSEPYNIYIIALPGVLTYIGKIGCHMRRAGGKLKKGIMKEKKDKEESGERQGYLNKEKKWPLRSWLGIYHF